MEAKRFDCPHCSQTGVCQANNGSSCGTCLKDAKGKRGIEVVRCGVCGGTGMAETKTDRLIARMPVVVLTLVVLAFYFYAGVNVGNEARFDQIFPLIASLTTMIVTFFFARK